MSVRINLEIGHKASIRTKRTQEGFTHDWEVFVRGADGADISPYVERVVFHLHETFQRPKRVVKEPPYVVNESGYAGFNLPIDIYLRNKDEPKKITFNYDLHLQNTGPPISKAQKEKYVFHAPSDDFRNKLLLGGGIIVNSSGLEVTSNRPFLSDEKNQVISKQKVSNTMDPKKQKLKGDEIRTVQDSFHELFGTPITKVTKVSSELKSRDSSKNTSKSEKVSEKDKSKSKYSPHKEKDSSKERSENDRKAKDERKKDKDRSKDKDQDRQKSAKQKSPTPHGSSPKISPKKPQSPKRSVSPVAKHKDEKKDHKEKSADVKSGKKSKKEKRDKDKDHKENKHREKDVQKSIEKEKEVKVSRNLKERESSSSPKLERREKIEDCVKEVVKEGNPEKNEKFHSLKVEEKQKHKHRKKDKDRKEKKAEKDVSAKLDQRSDKANSVPKHMESSQESQKEINMTGLFGSEKIDVAEDRSKEKKKPLNTLLSELSQDSSSSSSSSDEMKSDFKRMPEEQKLPKEQVESKSSTTKTKVKKEKVKKVKDKKGQKDDKRRKRKSELVNNEEPPDKSAKEELNCSVSDSEQNVKTNNIVIKDEDENQESPEDYMQILRDLQHKIMTLQDNSELQKVVQLIAETGRFEVSARTFDFDLCLLERSTVKQLQEFFSGSTT